MAATQLTREIISKHKVLTGFNRFMFFALVAIAINIADSLIGPFKDLYAAYVLSAAAVVILVCMLLFRRGYPLPAKIISAFTFNIVFFLISFNIGLQGGTYLYYFPFILAYLYLFRMEEKPVYTWLFAGVSLLSLVLSVTVTGHNPGTTKIPEAKMTNIFFLTFFISFALTAYFFILIYKYQENLYHRVLDLENNNRIRQLRSVIETQETENEQLMLELRDNINQNLAASRMYLEKSLEENNRTFVSKSHELTNEAINTLTMICIKLYPAIVTDVGLAEGIKEFVAEIKKINPVKIQFNHSGKNPEEMSEQDKIAVFRMIQDYLALLLKNAAPTTVKIELNYQPPSLMLGFSQNDPRLSSILSTPLINTTNISNRVTYYKGAIRHNHDGEYETTFIDLSIG